MKTIVLGYDDTEPAKRALRAPCELAKDRGEPSSSASRER